VTLSGRTLQFRARTFVLCAGSIENARILLLSDSVLKAGVGNQNDQVGRYFAEHGFMRMGLLMLPARSADRVFREERFLDAAPPPDRRIDGIGFAATEVFRERNRLLGFSVILKPGEEKEDADPTAAAVDALDSPPDEDRDPAAYPPRPRVFTLVVVPEQSPNPESRVLLHPEKDALGQRRVLLALKTQEIDLRSRRECIERLALALTRSGSGRVKLFQRDADLWPSGTGGHQTGTARMSDDPRHGVTDANARVHGVSNLFVGGGALFPTPGWQHPTLTIVALALRLADFLLAERRRASG
jgi:choline dehydrogenase-like flavoprotein